MSDIIPLNQIDHGESQAVPSTAPVIPLRNVVVFPGTITPLRFNKPENVAAIEAAVAADQHVVLVWQEDPELETVTPKALPKIGTLARLVRVSRQGDDLTVVAQARERVRLDSYSQETPFLQATFKVMLNHLPKDDGAYWEAAMRNLRDSAYRLIE
ncbi:MAG: LON peptidase substrate-binding domain-containing protein, partial [Verrucomicrobiales bacterium]